MENEMSPNFDLKLQFEFFLRISLQYYKAIIPQTVSDILVILVYFVFEQFLKGLLFS